MTTGESVASELAGRTIKEIFRRAEELADLHACITSPRGGYFRFRLLQCAEEPMAQDAVEQLRLHSGVHEAHRHLQRLLQYGLLRVLEEAGEVRYVRTPAGERAINVLRAFERRVSEEESEPIFQASLGANSIRFFLRLYGDKAMGDWDRLPGTFTPGEMGRLSLFLPRAIEGVSAVDKLHEARLVVYLDDNRVHMHPAKARSFYQYLRELFSLLPEGNGRAPGGPLA